ncbi:MAG: di-trans,poly-cis-decaprenylcistransferase [Caldithrix sp. RBG_13_44_9]|nr:MAG: di-trans,poly-cis-decaprenylcistransferase [Caldithrix sp. RBG_13_44_9]
MKNSQLIPSKNGLHVAIIMDGNGRWATRQGKPRHAGHQAGAAQVRRIVEAAPKQGISVLTLYAFSSDNWHRPKFEVNFLMNLFQSYLQSEIEKCAEKGVRLSFIGRRDRLNPVLLRLIDLAESRTAWGNNLHLRIAIDYSARDAILAAAGKMVGQQSPTREEFSKLLNEHLLNTEASLEVDLLIRTGGEKRLSDFLLWECAYAELYFTGTMWPDFDIGSLKRALQKFYRRQRRFGRVPLAEAI